MGNLTRNVELKYTINQTAVAEVGLAVNRKYKRQDGTDAEEVCFIDIKAFAGKAETLHKYLGKGDPIFIEGRLTFDQWEYEGKKHSKHRVIVENFQFLPRGERQQTQDQGGGPNSDYDAERVPPNDDIPF